MNVGIRILLSLRDFVLLIGIMSTGTIAVLLWTLASILAVLALVPLALGTGMASLCGWYLFHFVDSDVSDGWLDHFVKAIERSSGIEESKKDEGIV